MIADEEAPQPEPSTGHTTDGSSNATGTETDENDVIGEMRRTGSRLAAAIRAAADTEEAEALRSDVREGLGKLRGELDEVLNKGKDVGETGARRADRLRTGLRSELARALRTLNGTLERMAGTIAPGRGADAGSGAADADDAQTAATSTTPPRDEPAGDSGQA